MSKSRRLKTQKSESTTSHLHYGVFLIIFATFLAGCSKRYHDLPPFLPIGLGQYDNESVGRFKTSFIVEQIDELFRGTDPGPIGVTTFVDLNDLDATSDFGRVCAEQVLSELSMKGYDVIELRKSAALQFVDDGGEFMLSRSSPMLRQAHHLGGIVVGTYSSSSERVFVNARLLDPGSSLVLAAASVEMSKTDEIKKMLRRGGIPRSLERVPAVASKQMAVPLIGPEHRYFTRSSNPAPEGRTSLKVQPKLPGVSM